MDSDLARVNGKSARQSWCYADAFKRSIISGAIYLFNHFTIKYIFEYRWRWRLRTTWPLRPGWSPWCYRRLNVWSCQGVVSWGYTARHCCFPGWWRTRGRCQYTRRPCTTTPSGTERRSDNTRVAVTCLPGRRTTSTASTTVERWLAVGSLQTHTATPRQTSYKYSTVHYSRTEWRRRANFVTFVNPLKPTVAIWVQL